MAKVVETPDLETPTLAERIQVAEAAVEEIEAEHRGVTARLNAARADLDALIAQVPSFATSTDNVQAIQDYLGQQASALEERGFRMKLIKESGLDLKALAADLKSPLDAALGSRRKSG